VTFSYVGWRTELAAPTDNNRASVLPYKAGVDFQHDFPSRTLRTGWDGSLGFLLA
jgi:hypothetical protein